MHRKYSWFYLVYLLIPVYKFTSTTDSVKWFLVESFFAGVVSYSV